MLDAKAMLGAATGYLSRHPEELLRAARNATALRVGVPLAALRWAAGQLGGKKAPKDVELEAIPPGLKLGATVDLMGNEVRASATIFIESVTLNDSELRFELRLADVDLKILKEAADSPVATLLKSGALDLSKPGNLAAYMPKRPEFIIDAKDDRVVLDLAKHPKLGGDARVRAIIDAVLKWARINGIRTDWEHLDVQLEPFPEGVGAALGTLTGTL